MDGFETGEIGVGVVTGIRRWRLNADGWLCGLSFTERWTPGENVAVHGGSCLQGQMSGWWTQFVGGSGPVECADLSCGKCGYYAYFGNEPAYGNGGITGIVEGYGHVIIGTKGFRAQRARIVALCTSPALRTERPVTSTGNGFTIHLDSAPVPVASAALPLMGRNYPDVPIYATEAEMLAAHPTDGYTAPPSPPESCQCTWCQMANSWEINWTGVTQSVKETSDALDKLINAFDESPGEMTARARALAARKSRNTGPPKPRLDGRK